MKLSGRTILITGGSAGIGLAFALKLLELGNEVIVTGRRQAVLDQVKAKQDRGDKFHLVDVREDNEWAKDHLPGAIHLSKGIIERDADQKLPDPWV